MTCAKPLEGTATRCGPNQKYYDPKLLPLADDALLDDLCRDGEISASDVTTAKFRRNAPWLSDPISVAYRKEKAVRDKLKKELAV